MSALLHYWRLAIDSLRGGPSIWRVRYRCGGVSRRMPYSQARDYAQIFGGVIEHADR